MLSRKDVGPDNHFEMLYKGLYNARIECIEALYALSILENRNKWFFKEMFTGEPYCKCHVTVVIWPFEAVCILAIKIKI